MTWTYSGDPSSSPTDEVRFLVGDTDSEDQLLSDEEIAFILRNNPDQGASYANLIAAATAARAIGAKFTRAVDKTVGSLSLSLSSRARSFFDLADQLSDQATKGSNQRRMGVPQLGGGGQTFLMSDEWR